MIQTFKINAIFFIFTIKIQAPRARAPGPLYRCFRTGTDRHKNSILKVVQKIQIKKSITIN